MPLSDEELFHLDSAGFLVRQDVLDESEVAILRDHIERLTLAPETLPDHERQLPGGRSSFLVGHPMVMDVVTALLGPEVRMDACEPMFRVKGESFYRGFHRGSPHQADPIFGYRVEGGRIFLAVVRVLVELTSIGEGDGGTAFLAGSHKANFALPPRYKEAGLVPPGPLAMRYACSAGSAVFFPDGVAHTGTEWRRDEPRVAVLCTYTMPAVQYHRPSLSAAVLDSLPPDKQAFFRPVWWFDQDAEPPQTNTAARFAADPEPLLRRPGIAEPSLRLVRQSVKPSIPREDR